MNCNHLQVSLCHANELNRQKKFPLHFSPATKGPADIMSVILSLTQVWVLTRTRLEITLSCWLSLNNRLEASKCGWCLNHCSSSVNHGYMQGKTWHHRCFAQKGLHMQGYSTELAQEWQQTGVRSSTRTVRRKLLEDGLVSRRAAKKPLLPRKNIRDRLILCNSVLSVTLLCFILARSQLQMRTCSQLAYLVK